MGSLMKRSDIIGILARSTRQITIFPEERDLHEIKFTPFALMATFLS